MTFLNIIATTKIEVKESLLFRWDTYGNQGFAPMSKYGITFPNSAYTHVKHYATSGFEGILAVRGVDNKWYIPTLEENLDRLLDTMKAMLMIKPTGLDAVLAEITKIFPSIVRAKPPEQIYLEVDKKTLRSAIMQTIEENVKAGYLDLNTESGLIYVRPNFYRDHKLDADGHVIPGLGVASLGHHNVLEIMVQNVPSYLASAPEEGSRVLVYEEKLHRMVSGLPPLLADIVIGFSNVGRKFKLGGNYAIGGIAKNLAQLLGFDEALLTDNKWNVLEGGGENAFAFIDGKIYTPSLDEAILPGTKRSIVIEIARKLGYDVIEDKLPLQKFIDAEAAAFSGTWTGFEPIGEVNWYSKGSNSHYVKNHPVLNHIRTEYNYLLKNDKRLDPELGYLKSRITMLDLDAFRQAK